MMTDHYETSRPEARMLIAVAVPASVDINAPGDNTWPTSSGNVYTSVGCNVLVLVIKLASPAENDTVTKLTDNVAALAL
jgi:hypothetical protein